MVRPGFLVRELTPREKRLHPLGQKAGDKGCLPAQTGAPGAGAISPLRQGCLGAGAISPLRQGLLGQGLSPHSDRGSWGQGLSPHSDWGSWGRADSSLRQGLLGHRLPKMTDPQSRTKSFFLGPEQIHGTRN